MATCAPASTMKIHIPPVGSSPPSLLRPNSCNSSPTIEVKAVIRTRRRSSINAKTLSRKSAPQLCDPPADCDVEEVEQQEPAKPEEARTNLTTLPTEIQENILDCLAGSLCSISSSAGVKNGTRNWNSAMRHPRAKELTSLALLSTLWRQLIQERLYRHIRVKGSRSSLNECVGWFFEHEHLQEYVRHIDVWVPIWEQRPISLGPSRAVLPPPSPSSLIHQTFANMLPPLDRSVQPITSIYRLSSQSSSLDEIFDAVRSVFPSACILTIEGGSCRKPPQIRTFRHPRSSVSLTRLPQIRTLVLKNAWNMMRSELDFSLLSDALPNLKDFQAKYATPKTKPYVTLHTIFQHSWFPATITHLHLDMEGFYSKKTLTPAKITELRERHHLCRSLGSCLPQLEALTFSGRVCSDLFQSAIEAAASTLATRQPRLRSVDLVVRNCCRGGEGPLSSAAPPPQPSLALGAAAGASVAIAGAGIYNWSFIKAFERLVLAAVAALKLYRELNTIRIRYVDLDSPHVYMNPSFTLRGDRCEGLWSESILAQLAACRPAARYDFGGESLRGARSSDGGGSRESREAAGSSDSGADETGSEEVDGERRESESSTTAGGPARARNIQVEAYAGLGEALII